ncbi:MAG TPA: KEOPS complex subunit Cgi121 [Candidatus Bilamarchaeum sp.]|nr:KEOPS complex subunit Cgi121 [Candidatus Bilamarchaeum sp.]
MQFFRVRSGMERKALCRALEDTDAIALGTEAAGSTEEISLALHLAGHSMAKKTNIARKLKYEFILWLSGKRDIRSAMEATAPKEGDEFFVAVFSDDEHALEKIGAKKLPLGLKKKAGPLALEKISLSRVK